MTHTNGRWETSAGQGKEGIGVEWQVCQAGGGDLIASLAYNDNAEADANFIAAAPDMLAALELLRDEYCEGGMLDGTEAESAILAAIAKASGKSAIG